MTMCKHGRDRAPIIVAKRCRALHARYHAIRRRCVGGDFPQRQCEWLSGLLPLRRPDAPGLVHAILISCGPTRHRKNYWTESLRPTHYLMHQGSHVCLLCSSACCASTRQAGWPCGGSSLSPTPNTHSTLSFALIGVSGALREILAASACRRGFRVPRRSRITTADRGHAWWTSYGRLAHAAPRHGTNSTRIGPGSQRLGTRCWRRWSQRGCIVTFSLRGPTHS